MAHRPVQRRNDDSQQTQAEVKEKQIVFTRVFDAPPELVWQAWTDPKMITQWWGPAGFTTTTKVMDVRPGGTWVHTMHGPDGTDYPNKKVYIKVEKPRLLEYTHGGGQEDGKDAVGFHVLVTFEPVGDKTTITMTMTMPSAEHLQHVIETYGAVEGGKQTLNSLAGFLAKSKPIVRVSGFAVSLDGFSAGPHQSLENPLGIRGPELFAWFFHTRTFKQMQGAEGGTTGVDDDFARKGMENVGAWIMGRNMFGPVRGPWPDDSWKGWWGDEPVYHVPTFVLTHHQRKPEVMKGGTTFHFVTGGIHEALQRAREAAKEKDIRIGGGVATIRQFLQAGLIDQLHLAIRPVILGSGENLFSGLDLSQLGYRCIENVSTDHAMHVVLAKSE